MKGGRSAGIDDIDSFSLKMAAPHIQDVLLHLINLSLTNQSFPEEWKTQLIHPNYKKGDKIQSENYRPVSHIIEISKLVEYEILAQVSKYFNDNNLFHQNHHGSLPNDSTAITNVFGS